MEFVSRLKSFLYRIVLFYDISSSFYDLQPRCSNLPCYPVFTWLFWYIVWEREETLHILGDEIWPRISDPQKWMKKETPGVLCRDKWFHTWLTWKDFIQAFSLLFCNTGVGGSTENSFSLQMFWSDLLVKMCCCIPSSSRGVYERYLCWQGTCWLLGQVPEHQHLPQSS